MSKHCAINLSCLARASEPGGLLAGFALSELPKGYLLSAPGCGVDRVFIVRTGRLKVYLAGENRELSLSFLGPGDIYITHTPTYIRCVEAASIWTMDTRALAQKMMDSPSITPMLMQVLGRLLTEAVALIEDLAFREVPARLARFFISRAQRRGQVSESGWLIPVDLGMQDIAELLGTTRQTISLLINQWERDGLLQRIGRRSWLIPSLDALAACFPEPG